MINTYTDNNGFTLIEILIAMVVLSIGILGLYSMQVTAIRGNKSANDLTEASRAASEVIEHIMHLDFSSSALSATAADEYHSSVELSDIDLTLPHSVSSVRWQVTDWSGDGVDNDADSEIDEEDEGGMKHLLITVGYGIPNGNKQLSFNYLKTSVL